MQCKVYCMAELLKTPLYDFHQKHGARLVPFAGYEMPVQYAGILQEHRSVRGAAGLFDVSHMGEARVTGPQAGAFLDYLACNDVSQLVPGRAVYSPLCNEAGGVVDDVIIYCVDKDNFLVVLNASNAAKDLAWLKHYARDFDCEVADESDDWALLALQGPKAFAVLEEAGFRGDIEHLRRFSLISLNARTVDFGKGELIISRTGYTGEDGVEIFCRPGDAEHIATRLLEIGAGDGLVPAGLGARDSLRLEAGYPLYGHEIEDDISPLEAGLGWTVKLQTPTDFIGKAMLKAQKQDGPPRRLIHFIVEDRRIARPGTPVLDGDFEAGTVVSGAQSPILEKPIGSALVKSNTPSENLTVDIRGNRLPITVKKPPLHQ